MLYESYSLRVLSRKTKLPCRPSLSVRELGRFVLLCACMGGGRRELSIRNSKHGKLCAGTAGLSLERSLLEPFLSNVWHYSPPYIQVFHAPHIERMSSVLGVTFSPIIYVLKGDALTSNVKYSHPFLGTGWLSAGGTLGIKYDDTVEVKFDRFWIDGPETLRADISVGSFNPTSLDPDAWMTNVG